MMKTMDVMHMMDPASRARAVHELSSRMEIEMFEWRTMRADAMFIMAALVASLAFSAQASDVIPEEKMPASYAAMMKMKPMDVMHMMDADKKGYVTKDAFMKFHEALFDKMDKNKDGQLFREEWSRH